MPVRKTSGGYKSGYKAKTYKPKAKSKRTAPKRRPSAK